MNDVDDVDDVDDVYDVDDVDDVDQSKKRCLFLFICLKPNWFYLFFYILWFFWLQISRFDFEMIL